jgi:hypothetical protein
VSAVPGNSQSRFTNLLISEISVEAEFALSCACSGFSESARDMAPRLLKECNGRLDAKKVIGFAQVHGLAPLLAFNLNRQPVLQLSGLSILNDALRNNTRRSLFLMRELFLLLEVLEARNVFAVAHKGPALAALLYGSPALRAYEDIDVLVSPRQASAAKKVLLDASWNPDEKFSPAEERAYIRSGYEFSFRSPTGVLAEIQWGVAQHFYAVDFDLEQMLQHSTELEVAGRDLRILAPEDLLLALAVHAAKHMFERLSWLIDIAALVSTVRLGWEDVYRKSEVYGIRRILGVALTAAERVSGITLPALAGNITRGRETGVLTDLLLRNALCQGAFYPPRTADYFKMYARLRERPGDRIRLLARLLLTPGIGEWRMVSLPAPLFPLYVFVRLFRLICRIGRQLIRRLS